MFDEGEHLECDIRVAEHVSLVNWSVDLFVVTNGADWLLSKVIASFLFEF